MSLQISEWGYLYSHKIINITKTKLFGYLELEDGALYKGDPRLSAEYTCTLGLGALLYTGDTASELEEGDAARSDLKKYLK